MSSEQSSTAIKVDGVAKYYQIYDQPSDRLKQFVMPRFNRLAGRPAKIYGRVFHALDNISFQVNRGETVGIIGRNGSGKSTLLQIICGTLTPTLGTVTREGRVAALLELGAGFDPEFTGRENVYFNASILGLTREETDARMDDILAFADIGEFIDRPVKTYSSGMYVRLAFAVIAHVDADILIIDEALAVGDAFFVQKCMRFLRRFMENGTVLFVSHDSSAILGLCERAIWLEKGCIRADGEPKHVTDQYLKAFFEAQQGASKTHEGETHKSLIERAQPSVGLVPRDMRQDMINASPLRNELEVFSFDPDAEHFGKGGAVIDTVVLKDTDGHPLTWIVGGEEVCLEIGAQVVDESALDRPIIGFYIKDRLGQTLFGDNTFMAYRDIAVQCETGDRLKAAFSFRMPTLPRGDYSVNVALAAGTQDEHVHHHWIHDALMFKSHSSSVVHGLVGLPIHNIHLEVNPSEHS